MTDPTYNPNKVSQAAFLAPAPVQSPLLDPNGHMTIQWISWFNQLARRVGGSESTSLSDLDILTEFDDIPQTVRFPEPDVYDVPPSMSKIGRAHV